MWTDGYSGSFDAESYYAGLAQGQVSEHEAENDYYCEHCQRWVKVYNPHLDTTDDAKLNYHIDGKCRK